jgi:hypothetical protein
VENPWSHPLGSAGPAPTGGFCQHRQVVVNIIDHLHRLGELGLLRAPELTNTYTGHGTLTRPICRSRATPLAFRPASARQSMRRVHGLICDKMRTTRILSLAATISRVVVLANLTPKPRSDRASDCPGARACPSSVRRI